MEGKLNARGATSQLADFVVGTSYETLPRHVIEKCKEIILDQIGVEIGCAAFPWSEKVLRYIKQLDARGDSTILVHGMRTCAEHAAFVNGCFGHGFELDDYHLQAAGHAGCVVIPAALAVAESIHASGKQFLAAVAVGAETVVRLGVAAGPSMARDRGVHTVGTLGTLGAAAAAGSLLRCSREELVSAFGIAGSHSAGTTEYAQSGGDVKRLHGGLGAMGGVRSAFLAKAGLTGPATIVEGKRGIVQAFAETYNMGEITRGLGATFRLMSTCFKPYACCGGITPQIDAARALVDMYGLTPTIIESIRVGTDRLSAVHVGSIGPQPSDIVGAQMSAHFNIGLAIAKGSNSFESLSDAMKTDFRDPVVLDIARRVEVYVDGECDKAYPQKKMCRMAIITRDKRSLQQVIEHAKGTPENPLTLDEIEAKFEGLAGTVLPRHRVDESKKTIRNLEEVSDINMLSALLVA